MSNGDGGSGVTQSASQHHAARTADPARDAGHRGLPRHAPRVLMYHYFGTAPGDDPQRLFVTRERFAAQLDHLQSGGWHALDLDGYLAALDGAPTPKRSYLLTIDDGHESVARIAAPMLAERGIPSVLFVCPGLLGERAGWARDYPQERLSPADELAALPGLGMELGVHSWDHRRMFGMDEADLEVHVRKAHAVLQAATGVSARGFAYPFGTHDLAARTAVAAAGYDVAFAVAREHGRYAVDRVFVQSTDSLTTFQLKLTPTYRAVSRAGGRAWRVRHRVRSAAAAARRR